MGICFLLKDLSVITWLNVLHTIFVNKQLASLTFGLPPPYLFCTLTFLALLLLQVREATSNDPWGPSSSQMADISDLTYNVVACNEIMTMLWKRLKDDKNWRHIHKVSVTMHNKSLTVCADCGSTAISLSTYYGCCTHEISVYLQKQDIIQYTHYVQIDYLWIPVAPNSLCLRWIHHR